MIDQADTLRRLASQETRIITIASGKDRMGKSSLSVNLSVQLAKMGNKVLLLDATQGTVDSADLLGISSVHSLVDVLNQSKSIQDVVNSSRYGVKLISGVSCITRLAEISQEQSSSFLQELNKLSEADFLVIDTGASNSQVVLDLLFAADAAVIIMTPETTSIQNSYGLIKLLSQRDRSRLPEIQIVVNRVESFEQGGMVFQKVQNALTHFLSLHVKFCGTIIEDSLIRNSGLERIPYVISHPETKSAVEIKRLAFSFTQQIGSKSRGIGVKGFLSRLSNHH